jgi:CHASE2 domain-containing sensor protein
MKSHRKESLLLALASGVVGIGALISCVAASWRGWMTLVAALLGLLWADHFHHGAHQK